MQTATATQRGFTCACIKCGNADAVLKLDIGDLDTFSCSECEEEFNADDVRQFIGQGQAVLNWIDAAPSIEG